MRTQKCRLVVAVAVCTLLPVLSTGAKDRVTRPFKMAAHSQMVVTLADGSYVAHAEGVATHMGNVVADQSGQVTDLVGEGTITVASGAVLDYAQTTGSDVVTITGGTGRFAGATGQFTLVILPVGMPIVDPVAGTMTMNYTWTASGSITY